MLWILIDIRKEGNKKNEEKRILNHLIPSHLNKLEEDSDVLSWLPNSVL